MSTTKYDKYSSADECVSDIFQNIESLSHNAQISELKDLIVYFKDLINEYHRSNNQLTNIIKTVINKSEVQ